VSTPAEIAAAMASVGCSAEQIAGVLAKLQGRSPAAIRQARYRSRKASQNVTGDVTGDVTNHNESVTSDITEASQSVTRVTLPRAPIRAGVHDPQNLESKKERKSTEAIASGSNGLNGHVIAEPLERKRLKTESDEKLLDGVSDIWNVWAAAHGSPQVEHLTGSRAIHCRRRIAELMAHGYQTADEAFRFLLRHCDESFFVKGNPRKPLEFNQLLREDFVARMIEGSFKYQPQKQGRTWAS
jgi:hypothetical protein